MRRAPGVVRSNSTSTSDRTFVYWVSPKGEIQPAADTRITESQLQSWPEYRHWRRCEATGAKEIEKISLIISRQHWERKKLEKVQQHLREADELKQLQIRAKLRKAQGFSKNDVEMNDRILRRAESTENNFLTMIATSFTPDCRTTALQVELKEKSTSALAGVANKREGIA
jgi:hypothetical protein